MLYVNESTFKRCFKHYFAKPLIKGIEFCLLHAKLVIKSGKESFDCRNACREKKNPG